MQATYRDFLSRPPTINELRQQASRLQYGQVSVASYLTGLATSDEWLTVIVTRFYRDTLQREPDAGGLAAWVGALRSGQLSVAQAASLFYASDEFYQELGGNAVSPWVTQLYQRLLGRAPDAGGLENWVRNTDRFGRPWVSLFFYQSAESRSLRVKGLYQSLLQRDPDPTGWPHWTDALLSMSDLTLATQLASSQEYWDNSATRFPTVPEPPVIETTTVPDGDVGTPYSTTFAASGGTPPYTWAASGLPLGLSMNPSTGVIGGTPTSWMVKRPVTITVTDAILAQRSSSVVMTVYSNPAISTISLPYAVVGSAFTVTLEQAGGSSAPYTWSASGVPAGLSVDPVTGVLSGTATTAGSYPISLTVTDARGKTAHKVVTLVTGPNVAAVQVSAGGGHSCALTSAGGVRCWGLNLEGQLGDGTTGYRYTPIDVVGLTSGVVAISASQDHTCALTTAGGVKCWGDNRAGELGDGTFNSSTTPVDVVGLTSGVVAISTGGQLTCALTSVGGVKCWGLRYGGGLGDGTTNGSATPKDVGGLDGGVVAIAAGSMHACVVTTAGAVKCWGDNTKGQAGYGAVTIPRLLLPRTVPGLGSGVVAVAAGAMDTCALTSTGAATCWGYNQYGQLGDGTTTDRPSPVGVMGLSSGATSIDSADYISCALASGGAAKCWGQNTSGGLGDGTTTDRSTPVNVVGLSSGVKAVSAGGWHACAISSHGGVKCWGLNGHAELGDGTTTDRWTPVDVYGFTVG